MSKTVKKNVFDDMDFTHKFGLKGFSSFENGHTIFGELNYDGAKEGIRWEIAEWASRHLLKDEVTATPIADGGIDFHNAGKSVKLYPGKNRISLESICTEEYEAPRKGDQAWIHLLLEQGISKEKKIPLSSVEHLWLELEFEIPYVKNGMSESEFKNDLHTAQLSWYFTIENTACAKTDFEGRPDYYWFGLPLYDYRFESQSGPNIAYDRGTEKLIYAMDERKYIKDGKVEIGKTYSFKIDVIENVREGFDLTKKEGWLRGAEWKDMCIGSMNLGWEMPGTFNAEFVIKKMSVEAEVKGE